MTTTHPSHAEYVPLEKNSKRKAWERSLKEFGMSHDFTNLVFIENSPKANQFDEEWIENEEKETITFKVTYKKLSTGAIREFRETSFFLLGSHDGEKRWQYVKGDVK
jgi:hypothetical protein